MMKSKMIIAEVIRFYSLDKIMKFINEGGEYPLHHIWFFDKLKESGLSVECIEYNKSSFWNKLGLKLKIYNLQQQINLLKKIKHFDLIFAPFIADMLLLAILKTFGLIRKPLVGLANEAYTPYEKGYLKRLRQKMLSYFYMNGFDSLIFINQKTFNRSNLYNKLSRSHTHIDSWGVDYDFFKSFTDRQSEPPSEDFFYCTGGTGRDFRILFEAFKAIDFKLRVTTKRTPDAELIKNISSNIFIDNSVTPGLESVGIIRNEYYNSLAVAIPLTHRVKESPIGLTVLMEALSMGKPVISTRNEFYPFDLEKEKVGFEIELGDILGWREAINYLIANPGLAREMGERGRYLCEKKYNYNRFSNDVLKQINEHLIAINR